jgi:hypothetical protein
MNEDQAFAYLTRAASRGNIKLRDVATSQPGQPAIGDWVGRQSLRPSRYVTTRTVCRFSSAASGRNMPARRPDARYSRTESLMHSPGRTAGMPGG